MPVPIAFRASDLLRNREETTELYMNLGQLTVDELLDCCRALHENCYITKLGILFNKTSIERFLPHFEDLFRALGRSTLDELELWSCQNIPIAHVDRLFQILSAKQPRWKKLHLYENGSHDCRAITSIFWRLAHSSIVVRELHVTLNNSTEGCAISLAAVIESRVFQSEKLVLHRASCSIPVFRALEGGKIQALHLVCGGLQPYYDSIERVVRADVLAEIQLEHDVSPGFDRLLKATSESTTLQDLTVTLSSASNFRAQYPTPANTGYQLLPSISNLEVKSIRIVFFGNTFGSLGTPAVRGLWRNFVNDVRNNTSLQQLKFFNKERHGGMVERKHPPYLETKERHQIEDCLERNRVLSLFAGNSRGVVSDAYLHEIFEYCKENARSGHDAAFCILQKFPLLMQSLLLSKTRGKQEFQDFTTRRRELIREATR